MSAALKNYARKEPLLARYILKPVQLVHRTKIDQSKKNVLLKKKIIFSIYMWRWASNATNASAKYLGQTARISNSPAWPTWPIAVLHHTSKMATNKHFPSTVYRRDTANIAVKLSARPLKTSAPTNARLLAVEASFVTRVLQLPRSAVSWCWHAYWHYWCFQICDWFHCVPLGILKM